MDKKKGITLAIVLLILIGLGVFVFANPSEDEFSGDGTSITDGSGSSTKKDGKSKTEKKDANTDEEKSEEADEVRIKKSSTVKFSGNAEDMSSNSKTDNSSNTSKNSSGQTDNDAYAKALEAVKKAEESFLQDDKNAAAALVDALNNSSQKDELTSRIKEVQDTIDATGLVETLKKMVDGATTKENLELPKIFKRESKVEDKVNALKDDNTKKSELLNILSEINGILDDTAAPIISGAENTPFVYGDEVVLTSDDVDIKDVKLEKDGEKIENYELGTSITEVGSYKLTATDKAFNEAVVTFVINKAPTSIRFIEPDLTYNGGEKRYSAVVTANGEDTDIFVEVSYTGLESAPVEAGEYTVNASFAGNENYLPSEASLNFEITRPVGSVIFSIDNGTEFNYDGEPKEVYAVLVEEEDNVPLDIAYYNENGERSDEAPTELGTYTAKAYQANEPESFLDEVSFTVIKGYRFASINAPVTDEYDGTPKMVTGIYTEGNVTSDIPSEMITYYNEDGSQLDSAPINIGSYVARAVIPENDYYFETELDIDFTIDKAQPIVNMSIKDGDVFTYDGLPKEVTATITKGNVIDSAIVTYRDEANNTLTSAPIEPGTYTAIITADEDDNYLGVYEEVSFTITKTKVTPEIRWFGNTRVVAGSGETLNLTAKLFYNDEEIVLPNGLVITYKSADGADLNEEPTEVGSYVASTSFDGNDDYESVSGDITIDIVNEN